jgi:hypothetical protein
MAKELRTVLGADSTPELELVKEAGKVTIYEADDMDRQVSVPVSLVRN